MTGWRSSCAQPQQRYCQQVNDFLLGRPRTSQNRRSVYADGSAVMYGPTDKPEFRGLEGGENHTVDFLFFLDAEKKPVATAIERICFPVLWVSRPRATAAHTAPRFRAPASAIRDLRGVKKVSLS